MNNIEFASYAKSKVGCYYWFGTFGQKASKALYAEKKAQYPKYYTASDFSAQIANPKQCFDCAGLPKSIILLNHYSSKDDLGATGIYSKCKVKGLIKDINALKVGTLLYKGNDKQKTHVGVYLGSGKIAEAKGHAYGVVESTYNSTWKYYSEYYAVDYSSEEPKPDEPLKKGDLMIVSTKYTELMLRAYASTSAPILQRMKKGWKVTYMGEESDNATGHWLKVRCNTIVGWACSKETGRDYEYLTKL